LSDGSLLVVGTKGEIYIWEFPKWDFYRWLFLGRLNSDSVFSLFPVEVIFHFIMTTWSCDFHFTVTEKPHETEMETEQWVVEEETN
jgi:hypothetical protein